MKELVYDKTGKDSDYKTNINFWFKIAVLFMLVIKKPCLDAVVIFV